MPMKVVTVRRWEIGVAFVALTVSFVIVSAWVSHVANDAHTAATVAVADTHRIGKTDRRVIQLRNAQIHLLCRAEQRSSESLVGVLRLARKITLRSPNETPAQRRSSIDFYNAAIQRVRPLDCKKIRHLKGPG